MEDDLKTKLKGFGLTDELIAQLEEKSGAKTVEDLAMLSDDEIVTYSGCTPIAAKPTARIWHTAESRVTIHMCASRAQSPGQSPRSPPCLQAPALQASLGPETQSDTQADRAGA